MNIEQAKYIPISEILDKLNCTPSRIAGYDLYYLSPLRQEKTASFHVNTAKNIWYDHGIGEGGDGIKLVCKYLESCGMDHAVPDALRWLKNMLGHAVGFNSLRESHIYGITVKQLRYMVS